jgi:hypothetical protein
MLRVHVALLLSLAFFFYSCTVHGKKREPGPIDDDVTIDTGDDYAWAVKFTLDPVASDTQVYTDCEFDSCTFAHLQAVEVKENTIVDYINLPKNFKITVNYFYDVIPPEAARTNSQQLQSIYEIWSLDFNQPLLSIYRSIYGGQALRVQYNNNDIELDDNWYDNLHCIVLQCIASHRIAFHFAFHLALHCIALHCIALHRIASHCIASHRIASHSSSHCTRSLFCSACLVQMVKFFTPL